MMFMMPGLVPSLRPARSVVRAVPSGHRHQTSVAITMAAGARVRTLDEPHESTADDALDLFRMDDDGGWHAARPLCPEVGHDAIPHRDSPAEQLGGTP
jgi:hypothetical protein